MIKLIQETEKALKERLGIVKTTERKYSSDIHNQKWLIRSLHQKLDSINNKNAENKVMIKSTQDRSDRFEANLASLKGNYKYIKHNYDKHLKVSQRLKLTYQQLNSIVYGKGDLGKTKSWKPSINRGCRKKISRNKSEATLASTRMGTTRSGRNHLSFVNICNTEYGGGVKSMKTFR